MLINNQIEIFRNGKFFEAHLNPCVDGEFHPTNKTMLKKSKILKETIKYVNDYVEEEGIEYGYYIHKSCWGKTNG